jgi:hypothetical protein
MTTMPDDDLTFNELCEHLTLSPLTVRRIIKNLKLKPRRVGTACLYTREQANRIRAHQADHGGRWPKKTAATRQSIR